MRSGLSTLTVIVTTALVLASGCGGNGDAVSDIGQESESTVGESVEDRMLLEDQELTVFDQRITYPKKKPARISSETIVLESGEETGWRQHRIPVFVHVLSGTYTVDYGEGALVEYPAGSTFVQALKTDYNGINTGSEPASVLHVYLGAKGLRDVVER